MPLFLRHGTDKQDARLRFRRVKFCGFPSRNGVRAPHHGRPVRTVSQSGYPQGMWTSNQMLWRTHPILCTDRGTALWTNSYPPRRGAPDLALFNPPAVGEKNFCLRLKIRADGLPPDPHTRAE